MGLSLDRSAVEGRRQASHSFIAAAGTFAFLRDNVAMKASMGTSTTVDLSVECAGMLERLMLAQAQECVFENTIAKGSTPGVCAKISRQVCLLIIVSYLFQPLLLDILCIYISHSRNSVGHDIFWLICHFYVR